MLSEKQALHSQLKVYNEVGPRVASPDFIIYLAPSDVAMMRTSGMHHLMLSYPMYSL
jgi:hypothetical protein